MRVYHGTSQGTAETLVANPEFLDLTVGGGEIGQGFYTGESIALAMSWAKGRRGPTGRVLAITIEDPIYASLQRNILTHAEVAATWEDLRRSGTTRTFKFGCDVVEGPLVKYPNALQYKFESEQAATVLKRSRWEVAP